VEDRITPTGSMSPDSDIDGGNEAWLDAPEEK
jgi:hypothetical protein